MQEGTNARQQVVERIRQSTSILVAVGNNPSVDALAASLGLTLMLNKLNKHTTAVFSGVVPQAIQFLEPNKSFENNVDALRDFIISLDKEKADRLRYKVEDDVVRIFITPYKTSISQADLQFSQGDFNVDLIIALGVEKREDLDKAIVAHGRILHDATVITVNANNQRSTLGSIDWNDSAASSLCEMLVGASEVFQQPGILDAQISTALLTGIVAATDRFSNPRTSPRVMTMAAQLMAAGANQQLIATNLEKAKEIAAPAPAPVAGPMAKQEASVTPAPMPEEPPQPKKQPGELAIAHEKDQPKLAATPVPTPVSNQVPSPAESSLTERQEKELEAALPAPQVQYNLLPEVKKDLEAAIVEEEPATEAKVPGDKSVNDAPVLKEDTKESDGEGDYISSHGSWKGKRLEPPTLGGTLNATTEEAHEASAKAEDADRNKKLLSHPDDAQSQQKSRRNRGRRGRGGNANDAPAQTAPIMAAATATPVATPTLPAEPVVAPLPPAPTPVEQAPVADAPVMPPQPAAAPLAEPEPVALPAQAPLPAPVPEPPAPVAPELPPAPLPQPAPAPLPEPLAPVAPAALANPEELHKEVADSAAQAAAAAQTAQNVVGDLDSAREAVSAALDAQPFNPAGQPTESVGAQPMPAMPAMPVSEPLSPAALQQLPPAPESVTPPVGDLPPLPPMPPLPPTGTELPPAPDLPGLNAPLPPISEAPTPEPEQPPATLPANDPKQFKIPGQ